MAAQATGVLITTPNFELTGLLKVHHAPSSRSLKLCLTALVSVSNSDLPLVELCAADLGGLLGTSSSDRFRFFQPTLPSTYLTCTSPASMRTLWETVPKALLVDINNIHYFPLIHHASHLTAEGYRAAQT